MKIIPLTQGKCALVDDADFEWLSRWNWFARKDGSRYYVARSTSALEGRKQISMHRAIMNPSEGMQVDHINGDPLDNRRENLRVCTRAENLRNRRMPSHNTTGYKGVTVVGVRYRVWIMFNGKRMHVGFYTDLIEAARAYDAAAKKYFGKFARLNFPEND